MNKKNCVYILKSKKDEKLYVGQTDNLIRRIDDHSRGSVKATKHRRPLDLLFFQTFDNRSAAMNRESYIKKSKNIRRLLESAANMAPSSNG